MIEIDNQRLRNLTTGILHTDVDYVYQDLELILGQEGLMTHMLPNALKAIIPWLKLNVTEERFWNDEFDTEHTGNYSIPEPTGGERRVMWQEYYSLDCPLFGKNVVGVVM